MLGGVFGEAEGFGEAFATDAGEESFLRRSGIGGVAEDVAGFVVAKHDGFAGGTEDDEAGAGSAGVALDVVLKLAQVEAAVGVERSGNRGKDAVEKHGTIVMSYQKCGGRRCNSCAGAIV